MLEASSPFSVVYIPDPGSEFLVGIGFCASFRNVIIETLGLAVRNWCDSKMVVVGVCSFPLVVISYTEMR